MIASHAKSMLMTINWKQTITKVELAALDADKVQNDCLIGF